MKRRTLILSALGAGGALVVGWGLMPARSRLGAAALLAATDAEVALNGWIKINADGGATMAMPRSEMGQGVHTALQMLVAEELDLPLARVGWVQASLDKIYGNVAMFVGGLPFHPRDGEEGSRTLAVKTGEWVVGKLARELGVSVTGGSSSVADAWEPLRLAAATARASLLGAAALQWKLPIDELRIDAGVVTHASGKSARYGELARFAQNTPPGDVRLKPRAQWAVIGKSAARTDTPAKVDGSAQFGLDVRLPGMLYAAVRMCPMLGGAPAQVPVNDILRQSGVERVVMLPSMAGSTAGFAVVGKTYWHAAQAAKTAEVGWQQRPAGALNTAAIEAELEKVARTGDGFAFYSQGDVSTEPAAGHQKLEVLYQAPYLAHATLEPMNCTAQFDRAKGQLSVWAPTQVPNFARTIAARVAGIPEEQVTLHVTLLGGGFGRRLEVDFIAQAVTIALECGGRPVQLIWPREQDTTHDFYRPAAAAHMRAVFDERNQDIVSVQVHSAGDAITPRWLERALPVLAGPVDPPDKTASEGLFDWPYAIAHQRIAHTATRSGVPIGFWRAVGHSHNAFFSEGLINELAHALGQDALALRRKLLEKSPRHLAVLNLVAEKSAWGTPLRAGRARGLALHESFGSVVAQVHEISMDGPTVRVHRVVCAVDCGTVVNPQGVLQQMESAVVFGITAALHGRIDIQDGVVQQGNFDRYPMLSLAHAPTVQTYLLPSERTPSGVGEPGLPPVAPALAAAVFALTGVRPRRLPLLRGAGGAS
jgi:isoquinoline 1-oxidoreductase subunit beta